MAGKISIDQLMAALVDYQATHPDAKIDKVSEDNYMITEGGSSAGVELKDGNLSCPRSQTVKDSLLGFILDCATSPKTALSPVGKGNMSTPERLARKGQINGSALDTVRRTIDARPRTYRASGQEEAFAVEKIRAFEEMGGSFAIISGEVDSDHAKYRIRGTLPSGRYNESEYAVFRADWQVDIAWDMVDKQMDKFGNLIIDADDPALENRMPNLLTGAKMKVRKNDDVSSKIVEVPAAYHIATTVHKLWKFQPIQIQTKAKAKIAKELAGADDMLEVGEALEEARERQQVVEAA